MTLATIIQSGRAQHGAKFDASDLAPEFAPYYRNTGLRITVDHPIFGQRTGWIGKTTGWRPAFLLMSRVTARGSSDVLSREDRIVSIRTRRVR